MGRLASRRVGPASRILVVRPGALGDTILTLPAIRALRRAIGASGRIEWVGYLNYLRLAHNPLHADRIHSVDRSRFSRLFSEPAGQDLVDFLADFDLVVAWCWDDEGHLARLTDRLGVACLQSAPFPDLASGTHASQFLIRALKPLGVDESATLPEIVLSAGAQLAGREFLGQTRLPDGGFLAIHPGSGAPRKNWSPDRFSQLAQLARGSGRDVLLIEGEADREAVRAVRKSLSWQPPVAQHLELEVLGAVLSQAWAYVGNDSGITHLAAAVGAPTLAIFGPTDPRIWAPRGQRVEVLSKEAEAGRAWMSLRNMSDS